MDDLTKRMSKLLQQPSTTAKTAQQTAPQDSTGSSVAPAHPSKSWTKKQKPAQAIVASSSAPKSQPKSKPSTKKPSNREGMTRNKDPRLSLMPRPSRSYDYDVAAAQPAEYTGRPVPLLVILDLNGTLLARHPGNRNRVQLRLNLDKFLEYLFARHKVVVWSSATPESVRSMLSKIFLAPSDAAQPRADADLRMEWRNSIVALWNRKHLDLGEFYNKNPQVYKQLSRLWADPNIQSTCFGGQWDQFNTLLIDDSLEKAASEPHNLVQIKEMVWGETEAGVDVLAQVAKYISEASHYRNVSAFVRENPFKHDPAPRDENTWAWLEQNITDFAPTAVPAADR